MSYSASLFSIAFSFIVMLTVLTSGLTAGNQSTSSVTDESILSGAPTFSHLDEADLITWRSKRRPEMLKIFADYMYGQTPTTMPDVRHELIEESRDALNGKAVRRQVRVHFELNDKTLAMDILIYLPKDIEGRCPLFVGFNFYGNQTIHSDPAILLNKNWARNNDAFGVVNNQATEKSRGVRISRWPVELILSRGYGLATIYYGDIDPDFHDEFNNGIHALYPEGKKKQGSEWGSIGAWAWGLSRTIDYFETDDDIDHKQIAVVGHSRLGKTSLWAGAQDERFAIVISNNSGCGGAALSKRKSGETVKKINDRFPHWFCGKFKKFNDNEDQMPFDQHMLIALMAPRPVYVASASEDLWADPKGEFLSCLHADRVYKLLGKEGLPTNAMPEADKPVMGTIGYHVRTGKHDITEWDWKQYLNFADLHFGRVKVKK